MGNIEIVSFTAVSVAVVLMLVGAFFLRNPPKKVNYLIGYRTPASMRNEDNWRFAQTYSGKQSLIWSSILLVGIAMLYITHLYIDISSFFVPVAIFLITMSVFMVLIMTEIAIKHFEKSN